MRIISSSSSQRVDGAQEFQFRLKVFGRPQHEYLSKLLTGEKPESLGVGTEEEAGGAGDYEY
jgi:hypothetical protein